MTASVENLLDEAVDFLQPIVDDVNLGAIDKFKKFMKQKSKFQATKLEYAALLAYFGRIRTPIPVTSGQRFGIIRIA